MKCPYCNEADTKVIDSRPADDNSSIRRRRQCERCGKRFTTYEKLETMPLMVIKKDDSREAYDRSKIEAGILHSCHKRPVSPRQISTMIDEIENQIFNREEKEIPPIPSLSASASARPLAILPPPIRNIAAGLCPFASHTVWLMTSARLSTDGLHFSKKSSLDIVCSLPKMSRYVMLSVSPLACIFMLSLSLPAECLYRPVETS